MLLEVAEVTDAETEMHATGSQTYTPQSEANSAGTDPCDSCAATMKHAVACFIVAARTGKPSGALQAFTILEVVLALAIATAMIGVVLFFYRQAENLRTQLLQTSAQTTAARLLLERLSLELGVAQRCDSLQLGLSGGPNSLRFVKLDVPNMAAWTNSADTNVAVAISAFHLVTYALGTSPTDSNVVGLIRTEVPLLGSVSNVTLTAASTDTNAVSNTQTNDTSDSEPTNSSEAADSTQTNPATAGQTNTLAIPSWALLTDKLSFLHFRYCSGTNWQDNWPGPALPLGIEVNLGAEPLPQGSNVETYPGELFRRVIYLPSHSGSLATNSLEEALPPDMP